MRKPKNQRYANFHAGTGRRALQWAALALAIPFAMPIAGAGHTALAHDLFLDVTAWDDQTTTLAYADNMDVPLPAAATNIGPGSLLRVDMPGISGICTANFIWSGTNGKTYLGSAGHCFVPGGYTATHGPGADYDPAGTTVRVCVADCNFGGRTSRIIGGTFVTLGPVAYARHTEGGETVGHDFGLVEVLPNQTALVRPSLPVWGGPIGSTTASLGMVLCHYGNGVGVGEAFPTMARVARGVRTSSDGTHFLMAAAANEGDSGSAVVACDPNSNGVHGQGAVGILTSSGAEVPKSPTGVGNFLGTTVAQAISMATQAGLTISVAEGT